MAAGAAARCSIYVLVLLVALVLDSVLAGSDDTCASTCTFLVKGRTYTVVNKPFDDGVFCPEANPNKLVICNNGSVTIIGNFAAADLGVCDPAINPYTLPANANVTFEQYADQVIFRIPGRVASAFRVLKLDKSKKVAVGLSSQRYGISYLKDIGSSYC